MMQRYSPLNDAMGDHIDQLVSAVRCHKALARAPGYRCAETVLPRGECVPGLGK